MSGIGPPDDSADPKKPKARRAFKMFEPASGKFTEPGPPKALKTPADFEFIHTARPEESASTSVRKAVRTHVMRQFHKKSRERAAGTDRHKNQSDSAILPGDPTNQCNEISMTPAPLSSMGVAIAQIEPFRFPIRVPHEDPPRIEGNPAPADTRIGGKGMTFLNATSHNENTCARSRPAPRLPPYLVRQGPTPPLPGASQMEASSLKLLRFFLEVVARGSIPMSPHAEYEYFKEVTTGRPAFRHGTLLLASTYHALLKGAPVPSECHYYNTLTIRYVNSSLESVEGQIADGTLAAIACLAAFENAINPGTNTSVHLSGMEALIKLRSAHQCTSAEYLPKLVEWVDLVDATSNLTKPRFSPHQPRTRDFNIADEEEFQARLDAQWGLDFPPDPVIMLDGMDNTTAKLFHRVRQLSALATSIAGSKFDQEVQIRYTQAIQLLERQVNASIWSLNLNNIRQHGSATRPKKPIAVRTCTRTWHCTTLIFIYMVLRKTPPSSQTVEKLVRRAKFSLQILTPDELWVHFPPLFLLWVLVMAGIASARHTDRLWLLQTLKRLRHMLALDSWEAAKAILVQFAWVDHLCARPASLVWKELDTVGL